MSERAAQAEAAQSNGSGEERRLTNVLEFLQVLLGGFVVDDRELLEHVLNDRRRPDRNLGVDERLVEQDVVAHLRGDGLHGRRIERSILVLIIHGLPKNLRARKQRAESAACQRWRAACRRVERNKIAEAASGRGGMENGHAERAAGGERCKRAADGVTTRNGRRRPVSGPGRGAEWQR